MYVGDGCINMGGKNPDFVCCGEKKKIIELFGDYWHRGDNGEKRITHFKQYGYDTLIIWEHDLHDVDGVIASVRNFLNT